MALLALSGAAGVTWLVTLVLAFGGRDLPELRTGAFLVGIAAAMAARALRGE